MKVLIAALCLAAVAVALPLEPAARPAAQAAQHAQEVVPIVSHDVSMEPDGQYRYSYESGDGTHAEQSGEVRQVDPEHAGVVSQGSYSYTGDDGVTYTVTYVADEKGFQPQGDHLPVAPEVPPEIARALEYIAAHPYHEETAQPALRH